MMGAVGSVRIGITQRRLPATGQAPPRDALDAAWIEWFATVGKAAQFLAIPNFADPAQAVAFAQAWSLQALVLSGGDDVGASPVRDAVELALLDHAYRQAWPVLGVCRGMQLLHVHAGGRLAAVDGHVGQPHPVRIGAGDAVVVNSWHRWGVRALADGWQVLAVADDGTVEAMRHTRYPWLGTMWHPERPQGEAAPVQQWLQDAVRTNNKEIE